MKIKITISHLLAITGTILTVAVGLYEYVVNDQPFGLVVSGDHPTAKSAFILSVSLLITLIIAVAWISEPIWNKNFGSRDF